MEPKRRRSQDERKLAKSQRNRLDYQRSKALREHVLLRLDHGGAASLDRLAASVGLSRAACARMLLPALLDAVAPRLADMQSACSQSGASLRQFISRAFEDALAKAAAPAFPAPDAAAQFDALFGGER